MQNRILVLLLCILTSYSWSQKAHRHNAMSLSEIGFMVGGSYYIGDLNQAHFKNTNIAGQLLYRYNISSRLAYRLNFTYGKIEGYDSQQSNEFYKNRNLSFQSDLFEFGTGIEVTYFPFEIGNKRYKGTAYLLAELSLTRINPMTDYNGTMIELQPLGTEGQGTTMGDKGKYSRIQLGVPLAMGVRISITDNIGLNMEYGIRFMFTDYLDDVGGYRYTDPVLLAAENGPTSGALSNRSLDGNRFAQRGNRATRDWYTFFGIGLVFRMGRKGPCPSAFR
jgi:hypothetical protein